MDSNQHTRTKVSPFAILLLLLLSLILLQLYLFGLGVLKRTKTEPVIKVVEKEVTKFVPRPEPESAPVPILAPEPFEQISQRITAKDFTSQRVVAEMKKDEQFSFDPKITNATVRELVTDAKRARAVGDLRLMAVSLEQALQESPKNPHTLFLFGDMYEAMGLYENASASYESVISLGLESAGDLYRTATEKLKQGVEPKEKSDTELTIGCVNFFRDPRIQIGESIQLTIPILASPSTPIDPSQMTVSVRIYDKVGSEIVPCLPENKAACEWQDTVVDWRRNGTETLIARYFLPKDSSDQKREYYGYLVELTYGGRLIDQYCHPRILLSEINENVGFDTETFDLDTSGMDLNYSNLLLPPME